MIARTRQRGLVTGCTLALAFAACAPVPDLQFVDDTDAGARDAGGADGARLTDGDLDASISSDGTINTPTDAAVDGEAGTCPAPAPDVGSVCCGPVWCVGQCETANCNACATKCASGTTCCGKNGTVVCKAQCP